MTWNELNSRSDGTRNQHDMYVTTLLKLYMHVHRHLGMDEKTELDVRRSLQPSSTCLCIIVQLLSWLITGH